MIWPNRKPQPSKPKSKKVVRDEEDAEDVIMWGSVKRDRKKDAPIMKSRDHSQVSDQFSKKRKSKMVMMSRSDSDEDEKRV